MSSAARYDTKRILSLSNMNTDHFYNYSYNYSQLSMFFMRINKPQNA